MTILETERLLLRGWHHEDFDSYAAYYGNPDAARFVGGACSREQAWRRMAMLVGHWTLRGYGYWALEEKSSGALAGAAGLWHSDGWPELELGYWLRPEMQGKGYAVEAAGRARDFAFGELGAETLVSYIDPENLPSIKVAERLGARRDGLIELLEHGPHYVYRYDR